MSEDLQADVVVVGAGPAGLAAATHAAEGGASVLLLDRGPRAGGQVWRHLERPPGAARFWIDRAARIGVRHVQETAVVDAPEPGRLEVARGDRGCSVRYERLVLATGARERFLPFPGWTRPGVIGVGAAQALLKQGARFQGLRVALAGTGPLLLTVAAALASDGARIVGIAEQAPFGRLARFASGLVRHPGKALQGVGYGARLLGVPYRTGSWVEAVETGEGHRAHVTDGVDKWAWDCDVVACSYGLVPNLELPRLLGCELGEDSLLLDESQLTSVPGVYAAGELDGIGGDAHAVTTGAIAGLRAASRPVPPSLRRARARHRSFVSAYARAFALRDELKHLAQPGTIVCRCEDVPMARLAGCRSTREAKLRTRAGMGPCQSRVCGPALAFLKGWGPDSVRPPLDPVMLSVLEEQT